MLLLFMKSSSNLRQQSRPSSLEMTLSLKDAQRRFTSSSRLQILEILWLSRFRDVIWSFLGHSQKEIGIDDTNKSINYNKQQHCHISSILLFHNSLHINKTFTFAAQSGSSSLPGPQGAGLKWERSCAVDSKLRLRGRSLLVRACARRIACKQRQQIYVNTAHHVKFQSFYNWFQNIKVLLKQDQRNSVFE